MNGCTAAIIRTWPIGAIDRMPLTGLNAQSNTLRCSSCSRGAPSMVSFSSMYSTMSLTSLLSYPSLRGLAVLLHDSEHRLAVLRVLTEGAFHLRHPSRLHKRAARHDRGDGARKAAALIGVVSQAHRHEKGAEVGVAKPQRAQRLGVLGDRRRGVGGVGDDDLLPGEADVDCPLEPIDVDPSFLGLELHQV